MRLFGRGLQNRCDDGIHGCSPRFHAIDLTTDSFQRDFVAAMNDFFGTRTRRYCVSLLVAAPRLGMLSSLPRCFLPLVAGKRRPHNPFYFLVILKAWVRLDMSGYHRRRNPPSPRQRQRRDVNRLPRYGHKLQRRRVVAELVSRHCCLARHASYRKCKSCSASCHFA